MKLNLPNKLTVLRMFMVPVCIFFISFDGMNETAARIIAAAIFLLTSLTDMLDGMIARKYNLVTDFGKFLDPVADKLLVIGALAASTVRYREDTVMLYVLMWAAFIVIAREIAVTSLRMIVSGANIVVPANMAGKIKTVSQMAAILFLMLEPVIFPWDTCYISYIMLGVMTLMTIISGVGYFKAYWPYLNPEK